MKITNANIRDFAKNVKSCYSDEKIDFINDLPNSIQMSFISGLNFCCGDFKDAIYQTFVSLMHDFDNDMNMFLPLLYVSYLDRHNYLDAKMHEIILSYTLNYT